MRLNCQTRINLSQTIPMLCMPTVISIKSIKHLLDSLIQKVLLATLVCSLEFLQQWLIAGGGKPNVLWMVSEVRISTMSANALVNFLLLFLILLSDELVKQSYASTFLNLYSLS